MDIYSMEINKCGYSMDIYSMEIMWIYYGYI